MRWRFSLLLVAAAVVVEAAVQRALEVVAGRCAF
jgi:hypothetical protein